MTQNEIDEMKGRVVGPDDKNDFEQALSEATTDEELREEAAREVDERLEEMRANAAVDREENQAENAAAPVVITPMEFTFRLRRTHETIEKEANSVRGGRLEESTKTRLQLEVLLDIRDILSDLLHQQNTPVQVFGTPIESPATAAPIPPFTTSGEDR